MPCSPQTFDQLQFDIQVLNTQNGFSVQCTFFGCFIKIKNKITRVQSVQEACCVWQRKPRQTELSDRGQLMSRYINFMNLHPPRELAATHVLNGSCRQKRMPLCWNKWRGENGAKTTPLRCINLHLFILCFLFSHSSPSSLKKWWTACEGFLTIRQMKTGTCFVTTLCKWLYL